MKVKPIFVFNKQYIVGNTNFAIPNITEQLLNFFYRNLDTLLIGKYIGSTALGLYDRSYKFLMLPMQQVVTAFSKVMLPSFSNFKDRQDILISGYLKVIKIISWIVFPMMLTIFILSDLIVVLLFGEQWREMIPLLKVFSILGAIQSISSLSSYVFYLKDKVWLLLRYSIISKSIYFILLLFAVFLFKDIFHIVLAISFTSLIITLPFWYIVTKTLGTDILNLIKAILPQLGISLILAAMLYLMKSYIIEYNTGIFALILLLLLSIVFYWLINIISNNKTYNEIKEKIFDMITT
jgi:PST family polysaccharide transporter